MQGRAVRAISSTSRRVGVNIIVRREVKIADRSLQFLFHIAPKDNLCAFHDRNLTWPWQIRESLATCNDRCEILAFVIQKMVIEAVYSGTISAAPPIVSRAFQELSNGMVILNNVRKIKEIPFPFAFAQMQVVLLVCHLAVTATMSVFFVSQVWAVIVSWDGNGPIRILSQTYPTSTKNMIGTSLSPCRSVYNKRTRTSWIEGCCASSTDVPSSRGDNQLNPTIQNQANQDPTNQHPTTWGTGSERWRNGSEKRIRAVV